LRITELKKTQELGHRGSVHAIEGTQETHGTQGTHGIHRIHGIRGAQLRKKRSFMELFSVLQHVENHFIVLYESNKL